MSRPVTVRRRHAESVVDYLRTTRQPLGLLVTAAPLGVVYRGEDCCVLNVPAYLATRNNMVRYAQAHLVGGPCFPLV